MKGISVNAARLTELGLEHDRRWMVVRSNGRFLTQRDLPRLALIMPSLTENGIRLALPGAGEVVLAEARTGGNPISSKVWDDPCETIDQGDEVSRWLTDALESDSPLRLVAMNPGFRRPLKKANLLGSETSTFFADSAPFLVTNPESLNALNTALLERQLDAVPMNRFRPNIVVTGLGRFAEHSVDTLTSTRFSLSLRFPCERCVVTTIDQDTGEKDPRMQPFKTLAEINPVPGKKRAPAFGENAVLEEGAGEQIRVGDPLQVHFR
jgi:uncharacterized protein YcbX